MFAIALLSLVSSALALPGLGSARNEVKRADSGIPPPEIRNLWPQFTDEQWEKYHCLSFAELLTIVPPCSDYCETFSIGELTPGGFARDGCHQDDFPCHCGRSQILSDLIEPCIFPFLNATAECTTADLAPIQTFVTDSCTFFNATQYADYHGCDSTITKGIEADIAAGTAPKPSIPAQALCEEI